MFLLPLLLGFPKFMRIVTPSLLLSSMQVGTAFLRLCAVAGLFAIWTKLYETVYQQTSKWVMDHGELVLDISQTGGRRHERSSSGSDSMEEVQQARMSRTQARILSFALWLNEFTRQPDPNPNQNPQQAPRWTCLYERLKRKGVTALKKSDCRACS